MTVGEYAPLLEETRESIIKDIEAETKLQPAQRAFLNLGMLLVEQFLLDIKSVADALEALARADTERRSAIDQIIAGNSEQ